MLFWLIFYFLFLLLIGIAGGRRLENVESFFFAGRNTGVFLLFVTITASWLGAAATLATMEASFKNGFRAAWLIGIPTIATLLLFVLLTGKIRSSAFISLPAFLDRYYGKTFKSLAAILVYFYMVVLAASQFVAWGQFVSGFFSLNYLPTVFLGALIVLAYSAGGGFRSVMITDLVQVALLTAALLTLFFFLASAPLSLNQQDLAMNIDLTGNLLICFSFVLAWTVSPIIWQRICAARSAAVARKSLWLSAAAFILIYLLIMQTGLKFRFFLQDFSAFSAFLQEHLPYWALVLVFLGFAAAIMSTADTALNLAALTFATEKEDRRGIGKARRATVFSGLLAMLIAFRFDSIIATLGLASEIMAEGLFVPVLAALLWKKRAPLAGLFSLFAGGGFALLSFTRALGLPLPIPDWPYSLPIGLGLSLAAFLIGMLIQDGKTRIISN